MIAVPGFQHFGGKHSESAAIRNLLAFASVRHPVSGQPLPEALCLGIAGGIGAGYSFCPSVIRHGTGSGVSIVGRHTLYCTGPEWYGRCFDRLGILWRITETTSPKKAQENLVAELESGRPAVVWCGRPRLPFLGYACEHVGMWMHSFLVFAVDLDKGIAHGSDQAPTRVSLTLEELSAARNQVCTHKNRTLTIEPPKPLTKATIQAALRVGLTACAQEMLEGRMKTFSLPGLETWAKRITNDRNKDGWLKVYSGGLMFSALKDVYHSIATCGTGGDLFRGLFADCLDEAAALLSAPGFAELAGTYRGLGEKWVALADVALPRKVESLGQMRQLLEKRRQLIEEKGEKGQKQLQETAEQLRKLEVETCQNAPLTPPEVLPILEEMRGRIEELYREETAAAKRLAALASR